MILSVQPVGTVDDLALAEVSECLSGRFGFDVRIEPPLPEPDSAWDPKRSQYSSYEMMRMLGRSVPEGAVRVLGLTEHDLFIPALTFVFGQAQLDDRIALVSFARLRQQFYRMPDDPELFRARLRKEVIHEVGHTLGLIHCTVPYCVMRLSTGIIQVDVKDDRFCGNCDHAAKERVARWRQAGK